MRIRKYQYISHEIWKYLLFDSSHWLCSTSLNLSYTLGHLDKSHCHQCFCIQMLISAKCILWHNEQDIELVVVNDFLYKLFLGEDFFLMGFCKALSCCCCDINSAVMNIWKSWKTKQTKNLAKSWLIYMFIKL